MIIIGAGIGGLSAAINLANKGYQVEVYESSDKPGGKAGIFQSHGFTFDTGPSLFTMPFVLEELFRSSGKKIEDYVKVKPLDNLCRYFYPDGSVFNAYPDNEKFLTEAIKVFNVERNALEKYFKYAKKIYDLTADIFLFNSLSEISTFTKFPISKLLQMRKIDSLRSMNKANISFFKDPKLVQLFDRFATYNGSDPYKAPATLNIIPHVEMGIGGYYFEDGIYSMVEALYKLALEKGVKFHFNSKVEKILVENKSVKGIIVNGQQIDADTVISNSDVLNTYLHLLNDKDSKASKKYQKLEPSSSVLVFMWGVNKQNKDLDIHNIFFSSDYKKEFENIFDKKICPDDPTIYVNITSKYNSGHAPKGSENWFVLVNAPYNIGQDWEAEVEKTRTIVLNKLKNFINPKDIVCEKVLTPLDIEKTSSSFGSIYGISSNSKYAAFLRQQNRSKIYKGLYFCGGSAHPGGGIPLVLLSGKITADLVSKYS